DDGTLLIATGDAGYGPIAQNLSALNGKILRIRPTDSGYEIPADNPFVDTPGARPEIYALGLRNPFRMTKRRDGGIFVADVGDHSWEEVNQVASGANYGWPEREGLCPQGQHPPCAPAPAHYTDPVIAYQTSDAPGAITALAFYEGIEFPEQYRDK